MDLKNHKVSKSLGETTFSYQYCAEFKGDRSGSKTPRQTPQDAFAVCRPEPSPNPTLLAFNDDLADSLNLKAPPCASDIAILGGDVSKSKIEPYATCYGGHQFGHWAGQLGDGRAICFGQITDQSGQLQELQLKGSGQTPYSRTADGKAVLRSSLREYLMSEFMHHSGVPTTRALSFVTSGEQVARDMLYNGQVRYEPGAVVCRVAPNFLRFGHFEMFASRKDSQGLQQLSQFLIREHYLDIDPKDPLAYKDLLTAMADKTLALMISWFRLGFTHGVMNTDNMSALGLTIDYGPFAMIDRFELGFTPNTTDLPGRRYSFGNQASVAYWNLERLIDCFTLVSTPRRISADPDGLVSKSIPSRLS